MQQTLRLLLQNAYVDSEPALTTQLHSLQASCPGLFVSILPRSHKLEMDEDAVEELLISDPAHRMAAVTEKLKEEYCRSIKLPIRPAQIDIDLQKDIRNAYARDYGMDNVYGMGRDRLRWWKKLAFTDP